MSDTDPTTAEERAAATLLAAAFAAPLSELETEWGERRVRQAAAAAYGRRPRRGHRRVVVAGIVVGAVLGSSAVSAAITGSIVPDPLTRLFPLTDQRDSDSRIAKVEDLLARAEVLLDEDAQSMPAQRLVSRAIELMAALRDDVDPQHLVGLERWLRALLDELAAGSVPHESVSRPADNGPPTVRDDHDDDHDRDYADELDGYDDTADDNESDDDTADDNESDDGSDDDSGDEEEGVEDEAGVEDEEESEENDGDMDEVEDADEDG